MINDGIFVRRENSSIHFAEGFGQCEVVREMLQRQMQAITRTANELIRDGAIEVDEIQAGESA